MFSGAELRATGGAEVVGQVDVLVTVLLAELRSNHGKRGEVDCAGVGFEDGNYLSGGVVLTELVVRHPLGPSPSKSAKGEREEVEHV